MASIEPTLTPRPRSIQGTPQATPMAPMTRLTGMNIRIGLNSTATLSTKTSVSKPVVSDTVLRPIRG